MIVGACVADSILWWRWAIAVGELKDWLFFWATFWGCIIGLVCGYEIFATITKRMTISTMWKKWEESSSQGKFWSRTTLIILDISLNALIIHLWFH
jgi:hypothetical protein